MSSKNARIAHQISRNKFVAGASLLSLAAGVALWTSPLTHAANTAISAGICSGGIHTPTIISAAPANGNTVITTPTPLSITVDWASSITIKKAGAVITTLPGNNQSNEIIVGNLPLDQGVNNYTLSVTGGCPATTINQPYTLTYIKNAAVVSNVITNHRSPRLSGTFQPLGVRVFAVINNTTYQAVTDSTNWSLAENTITPQLTDNAYPVRLYTMDSSDVITSDITYPAALTIDTVPPTGSLTSPQTLTSRSPELTGTVQDTTATIKLTLNNTTYDAINNRNGTWTLPANTITPELSNGDYGLTVTITDRAGNVSTLEQTLTIQAPNQLGFLLSPNTGYLRINNTNLPIWYVYGILACGLVTIYLLLAHRRIRQVPSNK